MHGTSRRWGVGASEEDRDEEGGGAAQGERVRLREKPQQIADELRRLIVSGELSEGDSLGHEPDLVERFGVSRPSLREALRILEAEGLITVVRGMLGGIVVHEPDERMTARTAALVLQARNVSLADVHEARSLLEPTAVRIVASLRSRRAAVSELQQLVDEQMRVIMDPDAFGPANARFHERLVTLAGNQTLSIVAQMLNEIVARAVTAVSKTGIDGQLGRDPPPRHPLAGATGLAHRGRKGVRGRGSLAHAHDGRGARPARPARRHRHRPHGLPLNPGSGALFPQPAAQLGLHDLARGRARELRDRAHLLGPLLPRQALRLEVAPQRRQVRRRRSGSMRKKAHPCSPSRASGAATTATSATPGRCSSSSSTSAALTFSPPRMMMSFTRSVIVR